MNIEINRISVKNAESFFTGFYSETAVHQNAYKLRRMLDFRQAVPGDYLVIEIDGKPCVSLEIIRNNSRRFWENRLKFTPDFDKSLLPACLDFLVEYLIENRESIVPALPLFFITTEDDNVSNLLKPILSKNNYPLLYSSSEFTLENIIELPIKQSSIKLSSFIELPLEQRLELVGQHDKNFLPRMKTEPLYQDYIESGEVAETLWQLVWLNDEIVGYLMIAQKNLLTTPECELINYWLSTKLTPSERESAIYLMLQYIKETNQVANIAKTVFSVETSDLPIWSRLTGLTDSIITKNIYLES